MAVMMVMSDGWGSCGGGVCGCDDGRNMIHIITYEVMLSSCNYNGNSDMTNKSHVNGVSSLVNYT